MRVYRVIYYLLVTSMLFFFFLGDTHAQVYSPTPLPPTPTRDVNDCNSGVQCGSTAYCNSICAETGSCVGLSTVPFSCGTCWCTIPTPPVACGAWGSCILQYNGWYCQTRWCGAANFQIQCGCVPEDTGSGGGGATAPPGSSPTSPPAPSPTSPPPGATGTITAVARLVTSTTPSCADVAAGSLLDGINISMISSIGLPLVPASQIQSGGPVSWGSVPAGYTFLTMGSHPAGDYSPVATCYNFASDATLLTGSAAVLPASDTLNFFIGFTVRGPWVQTVEGDVYSGTTITTSIPGSVVPQTFTRPGAGGSEGVVTAGTTMTISPSPSWAVTGEPYIMQNLYATYYPRLKAGGTEALTSQSITSLANSGTEDTTVYTATGSVTVDAPITIPAGDKVIVLIDGTLTINNTVQLGSVDSFVAFIVNGNITVDPVVSGTEASPALNGVYIAGNGGTAIFNTGTGANRLVGKGMFIADTFTLARDVGASNTTTPSELFIFDPALLFSMPNVMNDLPYTWQEVAP